MSNWAQQCRGQLSRVAARLLCLGILIAMTALAVSGCGISKVSRNLVTPAQIRSAQHLPGVLKAHMLNGDLYAVSDWKVDSTQTRINGTGSHFDWNRALIDSGAQSLALDSVVIFETNEVSMSPSVAALAIVTVASVAVTIACLSNPKACFGSCPTFYVDDGDSLLLQAEGFSSSIAPALEATDIDALYRAKFHGQSTTLTMTNEAYETHIVRHADLIAVEKPLHGGAMVTSDKQYWEVSEIIAPDSVACDSPSAASKLSEFDGIEWFSLADSNDLAAKEELEISFPSTAADQFGLAVACRQSLMSTYLFYQTLSYMGTGAGDFFASLQRSGPKMLSEFTTFGEGLGNIEVLVPDSSGEWQVAGVIRETGPLATDMHLLLLPAPESSAPTVRVRLTKGYWRIDQIALVSVGKRLSEQRIQPSAAIRNGRQDSAALACLLDEAKVLITLPGDTVQLTYDLPQTPEDYEFFLESRGYYLEWMRENWLAQENKQMATSILFNSSAALKTLAPEYKRVEAQMEEYFWNSRYAK